MKYSSYNKLALMILISFLVMYLVMFLNMDQLSHYHTGITRIYMTLLMITPMAVLMICMMRKMYTDKRKNSIILLFASGIFLVALWGLRTQTPIGDVQYMKAMIPHHSSAIMTSKHADIKDPEVKQLSESIIKSQEQEIKQMEIMLQRIQHKVQ